MAQDWLDEYVLTLGRQGVAVRGPAQDVTSLEALFFQQSATPNDTAFGQWLHTSGFAGPMVIPGFGGQ